MKAHYKRFFAFILFAVFFCKFSYAVNDSIRVLFIGNSYTFTNKMPLLMQQAAASRGVKVAIEQNAHGGWTLDKHWNDEVSKAVIRKGKWNYIVLQEYSEGAALPTESFRKRILPNMEKFQQLCKEYNPQSTIILYMTWGRKNGDKKNCFKYPAVCNYFAMDELIRKRYLSMAENKAEISPVGPVWNFLRKYHSDIELYRPDGSHPSLAGSYASALSFYTIICRRNPSHVSFKPPKLDSREATIIKRAVRKVVYDSLGQWNVGKFDPRAKFSYSHLGRNEYEFTNESVNAFEYQWNFGDGIMSQVRNPKHAYAKPGNYTVKLIARKNPYYNAFVQKIKVTKAEFLSVSSSRNTERILRFNNKEKGKTFLR